MICTDSVLIQQDEPSLIGASVLPLAPTAEGQSLNGAARRVACDSGLHTGYMTYCRHQCPQDTVVVPRLPPNFYFMQTVVKLMDTGQNIFTLN